MDSIVNMNKFIEYDINNGIILLKCAIMNVLKALDSAEIKSYKFDPLISFHLIKKCMNDSGWSENDDIFYSPSLKGFMFFDDFDLTKISNGGEC